MASFPLRSVIWLIVSLTSRRVVQVDQLIHLCRKWISLKENRLSVSGERKFTKGQDEKHFRSIETHYGAFRREFVLPENVDGENIQARYNNGILELVVPKDEKKLLKTTIKVA